MATIILTSKSNGNVGKLKVKIRPKGIPKTKSTKKYFQSKVTLESGYCFVLDSCRIGTMFEILVNDTVVCTREVIQGSIRIQIN